MLKVKHSICCLLLLALIGCISEYTANLPASDEEILIVEGNIVENSDVVFSFSKSFPLSNDKLPEGYNEIAATVVVTGSDGYRSEPGHKIGTGKYQVSVGVLKDNVAYGIEIECDGEKYSSVPAHPLVTPKIDSVSWTQPVPKEEVNLRISTHGDSGQFQYYMWTYTEDWETTAYYFTTCYFDPEKNQIIDTYFASPFYYCWRNSTSRKILIGTTESLKENRIVNQPLYTINPAIDKLSVLYSVLVQQRALSKEAHDYYLNLQKQNEGMGGLFTPQPSEVQGNISCSTHPDKKVIGYVEVLKNVVEERIFIAASEVTRPRINSTCEEYDAAYFYELGLKTPKDWDKAGYAPTTTKPGDPWSEKRCTNCEVAGGTKNKPKFWPNNHE